MGDWYPHSRDEQLHMIDTWINILNVSGSGVSVPVERKTALEADWSNAYAALAAVKADGRTHTNVIACNIAFQAMETEARFIKKHYLLMPPLLPTHYTALLLPLPDTTHTPVGPPAGQPVIEISYPGGPHLLEVRITPLAGTLPPDSRGDYGVALYRGLRPAGGATTEQALSDKHYLINVPLSGNNLFYCRFTRRKTERIVFDAEEAGMTAFFCARYENQKGDSGPWGPVASAVVP